MRSENARCYNAIAEEYNREIAKEAEVLMDEEVEMLQPCLQSLKGRDPLRWKRALERSGVKIPAGHQIAA